MTALALVQPEPRPLSLADRGILVCGVYVARKESFTVHSAIAGSLVIREELFRSLPLAAHGWHFHTCRIDRIGHTLWRLSRSPVHSMTKEG